MFNCCKETDTFNDNDIGCEWLGMSNCILDMQTEFFSPDCYRNFFFGPGYDRTFYLNFAKDMGITF